MSTITSIPLSELIRDRNRKRFIENLLVIEGKNTVPMSFKLNPIQDDALSTETGRDIYVKPAQVGFSSVKLAERLIDTITTPGTNTVLIAYEDFITERLLSKTEFFYNHLASLNIPGFPEIHHNCLPYHSKIQLADGTFRQIGQIVNKRKRVEVLSCNIGNGDVEPKKVVGWFKYPSNHQWITLGSGHKFSHMMTPNHPIYTDSGWKMASNVDVGDTTWHNGFIPNSDQKQLIIGSILGDGSLSDRGIKFGQADRAYAMFKYSILKDECSDWHESKNHGYPGSTMLYTFSLHNCPYFESWGIDDIDARGLAIWYCDDGCCSGKWDVTNISTDCFDYSTQLNMKAVLMSKFGVLVEVRPHGNYQHLTIPNPPGGDNHNRFFSLIAPYVPECMEYKLPERFRGKSKYVWNSKFGYGLLPYDIRIKEVALTSDRIYNYVYNVEVEGNHNYFTSVGLCKNSTYEKTYLFKHKGVTVSKSSIYIASSGSKVAGRAEVIHHLVADEFAFWVPGSVEKIFSPALDRVPADGTVDVFSTCNGQENEFYEMYLLAKNNQSVFKSHFYPWWLQPEYKIVLGDTRILRHIPETVKPDFYLTEEESVLVERFHLTLDQIRWRRWKILEKESLSRSGETRRTFKQEFPEDDESCFLSTGDSYFDPEQVNHLSAKCYPAPKIVGTAHIWHEPEKGQHYMVAIDPGQARITQSAITVGTFKDGKPIYCARDSGLYTPGVTYDKAIQLASYYNRAICTWEDNGHGLALTVLFNNGYRPVYRRKDIVSGQTTMSLGWRTTGGRNGTKHYMMNAITNTLPDTQVEDIELINQLRNIKLVGEEAVSVGLDDIFMSWCVFLSCWQHPQMKRGLIGQALGWRH